MGYIYVIENNINGKKYIGKTLKDIEKRFKEHIRESRKEKNKNRPLYRAFNKYGVENFKIKLLEIVDDEFSNQREMFWINKLGTFGRKGYNATKGGDGTYYINREEVIRLYNEIGLKTEVAEKLGIHATTVSKIVNSNCKVLSKKQAKVIANGKKICQLDLEGNLLNKFDSIGEGALFLGNESKRSNISACCRGTIKSAYGFYWTYDTY